MSTVAMRLAPWTGLTGGALPFARVCCGERTKQRHCERGVAVMPAAGRTNVHGRLYDRLRPDRWQKAGCQSDAPPGPPRS
jgi:hypothetical protein